MSQKTQHIPIQNIDPSPFQKRQYFDEEKIRLLAKSIQKDNLIQPIIVRPKNTRFELIAGERRLRAVKNYTNINKIEAKIIKVNDLTARRIAAAENLQRENYSVIETIEAIVDIVDAELIENKDYAALDNSPEKRVRKLLSQLDSVRRNEHRKYQRSSDSKKMSHKFVGQVEKIFQNLPKPLEWRSFFNHDLSLLTDICNEIKEISDKNQLNKSKIRTLLDIKKESKNAFQYIINANTSDTENKEAQQKKMNKMK